MDRAQDVGGWSLRPWHARVALEDLVIVTWSLEPESLRQVLPPPLEPIVDGGAALLSAVFFRSVGLRAVALPWPCLSYPQVNVRSYVRHPADGGAVAVYFHRLVVANLFVSFVNNRAFGLPFEHAEVDVIRRSTASGFEVALDVPSALTSLRAPSTAAREGAEMPAIEIITGALIGYALDARSRLVRIRIRHGKPAWRSLSFSGRAGLVETLGVELEDLHSCLYADRVDFEIELPPRRVSPHGPLQPFAKPG